ncbi:MAG TPA: hypothetical protein DC049_07705 [Spirochaetia bacterium]|nr:hypothetical protein [Spirochaetia bacterium]
MFILLSRYLFIKKSFFCTKIIQYQLLYHNIKKGLFIAQILIEYLSFIYHILKTIGIHLPAF